MERSSVGSFANLNTLMSTADSAQLTELFNGLGQLTSAVVGGDGQLTALLDSGDRAVASLAHDDDDRRRLFRQVVDRVARGDEVVDGERRPSRPSSTASR